MQIFKIKLEANGNKWINCLVNAIYTYLSSSNMKSCSSTVLCHCKLNIFGILGCWSNIILTDLQHLNASFQRRASAGERSGWTHLYFFKAVVLGSAKPRMQWRCPCEIVSGGNCFRWNICTWGGKLSQLWLVLISISHLQFLNVLNVIAPVLLRVNSIALIEHQHLGTALV